MGYYSSVRWRVIQKKLLFFAISFFFLSFFPVYSTLKSKSLPEINFVLAAKADFSFQRLKKSLERMSYRGQAILSNGSTRRILGGLGSSPPRCMSKCGRCTPCRPVHVPVPPGTPVTAEYYPEAWRCKCGNKFYMP